MEKKMITRTVVLLTLLAHACALSAMADAFTGLPYTDGDVFADTWVASDALGRTQPDHANVGPPKADRWVGIFYWTWHIPGRGGPNDNTKILAGKAPGDPVDWPANGAPHFWGEPELGYYIMTDPFVIRKHASMLVDAGIDVVLFDTTNPPHTWKECYEALCREYTAMRAEGARTPAIGFICPFGDPTPVLALLWADLYQPGLWPDLWFRWDGKPFILANKSFVNDEALLDFFTWRRPMPDYWLGPDGPDQWSWLEVYPQHIFRNAAGEAEQMSVGVAHNALPNTPGPAPMSHKSGAMGRSWHDGARDMRPDAVNLGLNFEEQWRRALEVDPKFIFVTGWNEWIAGRYQEWHIYTEADAYFRDGLFVDQYDHEYSRDCEPMRGGHTDNYYYQLASQVRRYKGVRPMPKASGPSVVTIDGDFAEWGAITPEFRDTIGDVTHRDHPGYGETRYTNTTGRNDFVLSKAAYDEKHLYFFVQTREPITPCTGAHWMLLLLDADQNGATGWLGYDYVVNLEVPKAGNTTVKQWRDGAWEDAAEGKWAVNGNGMELSIPRSLAGEPDALPAFDFHWADNIQHMDDVSALGVHGDNAPNRRWNYRYAVAE
jgi:hypothetical protein